MDAQIQELAYGVWFGCKNSSFLREAAGRLGGSCGVGLSGLWVGVGVGVSVEHLGCSGQAAAYCINLATRQVASLPSGAIYFLSLLPLFRVLSRRHYTDLVSLIHPVTIPISSCPDTSRCLAAGVSSQTLLAAKILRKGLPGPAPQLGMAYRFLRLMEYQTPPGEILRAPLHPM